MLADLRSWLQDKAGGKQQLVKMRVWREEKQHNENSGEKQHEICCLLQRLLGNKLLLKVEMFTSIERRFMPLTGNYFTASLVVALSSGHVFLTLQNNLASTFTSSINTYSVF